MILSRSLLLLLSITALNANAFAATIIASATTTCTLNGVTTTSTASSPGNARCEAQSDTGVFFYGSASLYHDEYSVHAGTEFLVRAPQPYFGGLISVNATANWSNAFILTGGTGLAQIATTSRFAGAGLDGSYGCFVSLNGQAEVRCGDSVTVEFDSPFVISARVFGGLDRLIACTCYPGGTSGYSFRISRTDIRQDGLLVDGASLDAVTIPEPSTLCLTGLAIAAVTGARTRQRWA